jgi:hypothetical protein
MKKGLLQDNAAKNMPLDPSSFACNYCAAFCLLWTFKTLLRTLSAWGYSVCPTEEMSGPQFKDWSNKNCKGWFSCLPVSGVCAWVQVCAVSLASHEFRAIFLLNGPPPHNRILPNTGDSVVIIFSHLLLGVESRKGGTAYCYMKTPSLRGAMFSDHLDIFHGHMMKTFPSYRHPQR